MLFRIKSMLTMAALTTVQLLFSQYAAADTVTMRATGTITSLSSWQGQPVQIGDTWTLTYYFVLGASPDYTDLPKGWDYGSYAEYWNPGFSLTVAGQTFDNAAENFFRASVGAFVLNDAKYNSIPGEADHIDDRFDVRATDYMGNGDRVDLYLNARTPVGSTPNLLTSTVIPLTIDTSAAAQENGFVYYSQFGSLRGRVSSIGPIAPQVSDLTLTATVDPQPPVIGRSFTHSLTVTNLGPDSAIGTMLNVFFPEGIIVNSADSSSATCYLENPVRCYINSAAIGQTSVVLNLTAATANVFNIDASVASYNTDSNSDDNIVSTEISVTGPDLISNNLKVLKQGDRKLEIKNSVKNSGLADAIPSFGEFYIQYFLSQDEVFSPETDFALSTTRNGAEPCISLVNTSIAVGSFINVRSIQCFKPSSATGNSYFVLAVIDSNNDVLESDETNNTGVSVKAFTW